MKTSKLIGAALDWAVMYAVSDSALEPSVNYWLEKYINPECRHLCESPSTDWAQGGPIIEMEKISVTYEGKGIWIAGLFNGVANMMAHDGPTPLIAAMRCYVVSKLGDEVEVPEALRKDATS